MNVTWDEATPPKARQFTAGDWVRVVWRGGALGLVVFGCLGILLLVRLVERPLFGMQRPVTPWITQFVCRMAFVILRLPVTVRGPRMTGAGALVSNHASWLDIFALNSRMNVYFVSKQEVAGWPGIGWLARATGTVFIARKRHAAAQQTRLFEERLIEGHRLLFFPEGTSTDGLRVLPFKTTLFAAFFSDRLRHVARVQAVTVVYHPPEGEDVRFYGWWGDMAFGPSLMRVLGQPRQGRVEMVYHAPVRVDDFPNRKSLASHVEGQVRRGHAEVMAVRSAATPG